MSINNTKPPVWFWIVAVIFVVWNLIGASNYLMAAMATPESLAAQNYTDKQIEFLLDVPKLYLSVFALAVWSGLLASFLFIFRRRWAVPVFLFSLIFVLLSFTFDFVGGTFTVLGNAYLFIMIVVLVLAIIEVFFSRMAKNKEWLR